MLEFLLTQPEDFIGIHYPFIISVLQAAGSFFAECTNMFMLATCNTVVETIMFFVAFHVLNEIDNIYVESVSECELLESCDEPLFYKRKTKNVKWKTRSFFNKIYHIIWCILNFLHNSVYFYYFPYLVNFLPYLCPGNLDAAPDASH